MTLATFLADYGYLAIFSGAFIEGESVLLMCGFAAHHGYLHLPGVLIAAFLGGLISDQAWFRIGRHFGKPLIESRPKWKARAKRIHDRFERHHTWVVLGLRFMYGFRIVGPMVIGMSEMSALRYTLLDTISAAIWAIAVGTGGWFFGEVLRVFLERFKKGEKEVVLGLLVVGALALLFQFYEKSRIEAKTDADKDA